MSSPPLEWNTGDPLPPFGAELEVGYRDQVRILRGENGWKWSVNNHDYEPCDVRMLYFWAPWRITFWPRGECA